MKYFCTLLHDKGPLGPTKRYAQLTRQNEKSQEIMSCLPIVAPHGPELNWNKFTVSC